MMSMKVLFLHYLENENVELSVKLISTGEYNLNEQAVDWICKTRMYSLPLTYESNPPLQADENAFFCVRMFPLNPHLSHKTYALLE